jgi:23S rRNA (guanosine2251-2'-O)-methyltransferase
MGRSPLIYGLNSLRSALEDPSLRVSAVWVDAQRDDPRVRELVERARGLGIEVHRVARRELEAMLPGVRSQGVAAHCQLPETGDESDLRSILEACPDPLLLVLDGVQDPHNLGACLRTAEAAGAHAVVAPKDRAVGLTPAVCRVASGAAGRVPLIRVTNLARCLRELKERGLWVVGTAAEASAVLFEAELSGPLALVMGGEEKGLRRLTRESCDLLVRIPMAGSVGSLNVSVAAGVALFESVRQRSCRLARTIR